MRRHTPTLYTHPEQDSRNDNNPSEWGPATYTASPIPPSPSVNGRHVKPRAKHTYGSPIPRPPPMQHTSSSVPRYPDVYNQFVKRYRSTAPGGSDDPRDDPDSHYFHRGLGQLVDAGDAGDSDEEDLSRGVLAASSLLETDSIEPASEREKERLSWQIYFASVLGGDVLRSEKSRIADALESSGDDADKIRLSFWYGIRAKIHGRTVEEEKKIVEDRRIRLVDPLIEQIMKFRVDDGVDPSEALPLVQAILRRLDHAHSLYPNLKAFYLDKSSATPTFQARCDALNTWASLLTSIRHHVAVLKRWTGSEDLDVTQPNTSGEVPLNTSVQQEVGDGTSFVERMLKEESLQRMFEKRSLVTSFSHVAAARDAQVNLGSLLKEMNLPTIEDELLPVISFPTKLAQACLHVRLAYVQKITDPDMLILDQMIDDMKISIGLACMLKRQYETFLAPDPDGRWNLPRCISEDYDDSILDSMLTFFRLIHWKLKGGAKDIYFKETDVLEAQWATMNDVSSTVAGGSCLVAEQLCSLTNRLMVRVVNYFDTQLRVPMDDLGVSRQKGKDKKSTIEFLESSHADFRSMTDEQKATWYGKILDSVRLRYRKLQRFARVLTTRFTNSAEYSIDGLHLESFIECLVASDHFLVYTHSYEEDGIYVLASNNLYERPETLARMVIEAYHVDELASTDDSQVVEHDELRHPDTEEDDPRYILIFSPRSHFLWRGRVMLLPIPKVDLEPKDDRVRLVADGPQNRLTLAKRAFQQSFLVVDDNEEPIEFTVGPLACLVEQQAHVPSVNRELRKIARATMRLGESIVESVHLVRRSMNMTTNCQELMENWYLFASEHGQHAQKFMDRSSSLRLNRMLIKLAISWVSFICDDCAPNEQRTFKWAVNALEFAFQRTKRSILQLPDEQFQMLRHKVGICITLLMGHFDILGARSSLEAMREKERLEHLRTREVDGSFSMDEEVETQPNEGLSVPDAGGRNFWERIKKSVDEVESQRTTVGNEYRILGRVLDTERSEEDRSLVFLASSTSSINIRWQQGRFIGAGAFGSVYLAVNLDSGSLMAVKEIKFQELSGVPNLYSQIKDELSVMEMLHHPNVVEYYGIEVHRDKVYIFEEYCQGGSLSALLEHGRIEDERIIQVYTMQMLEGLLYLHSKGIVHRDIKPDNILLDHLGVIKFVDFGAAKMLAKNQKSLAARSRRSSPGSTAGVGADGVPGLGMNSLTGTPMYMSPEIIKNDKQGRHGAMDIWSMGCVVLEFATGRKPWSNLDNEWAIMFHIGVATQHPPLPEPGQLSNMGIDFIKQCLTIDANKRPTAVELLEHPWMLDFRAALLSYEEEEAGDTSTELPSQDLEGGPIIARDAAIIRGKEIEEIKRSSPNLEGETLLTPLDEELEEEEGLDD